MDPTLHTLIRNLCIVLFCFVLETKHVDIRVLIILLVFSIFFFFTKKNSNISCMLLFFLQKKNSNMQEMLLLRIFFAYVVLCFQLK